MPRYCNNIDYSMNRRDFLGRFGLGLGGVALHFLVGQPVSAREALVVALPSAVLAAVLALGIYRLCRASLAVPEPLESARQVELV